MSRIAGTTPSRKVFVCMPAPVSFCARSRSAVALVAAWMVVLACGAAGPAHAAGAQVAVGRTVIALGTVQARAADGTTRTLRRHDALYEGDTLQTSIDGRAQFNFNDGGRLALRPATELAVEAYHDTLGIRDEKIAMRLIRGGFRTVTGRIARVNHAAYRMSTPYAVIGIRGTDWGATLEAGGDGQPVLLIGVNAGGVTITNDGGSLDIGANAAFNFARVSNLQLPPQGLTTPPPQLAAPLASELPPAPPPPPDASAEGSGTAPGTSPADAPTGAAAAETPANDATKPDDVVFQYGNRCL